MCRTCTYRYHRETNLNSLKEKVEVISLIDNKTNSKVASVIFTLCTVHCNHIYINSIKSYKERQGHATRLIRLVQTIARAKNLPIELDAFAESIGFFERMGFKVVEKEKNGLTSMIWGKVFKEDK